MLRLLIPYIMILASFGAFVFWNGGVVLGDKSNHVATLHLTQMLYLWPYMTFFSIPLTFPYLVQGLFGQLRMASGIATFEPVMIFGRKRIAPRLLVCLVFILLALVVVYFNTIVHPFTLADNRHYTFYVFRLLMRRPSIKYLVTPIYIAGGWSVIQTLGAPVSLVISGDINDKDDVKAEHRNGLDQAKPPSSRPLKLNRASTGEGCTVLFVLIWLGTSALQLVTAPLVEPRYFILPWLMWRLFVPQALPTKANKDTSTANEESWLDWLKRNLYQEHDERLWLETAWFLLINFVTGYIFLYWGFEWKQEPGKLQRFMW